MWSFGVALDVEVAQQHRPRSSRESWEKSFRRCGGDSCSVVDVGFELLARRSRSLIAGRKPFDSEVAHHRRSPARPGGLDALEASMSHFLYRLGQRCARHPWRVVGVWLLIALAVLGLNSQLGGSTIDNFTVPGVEAQRGRRPLDRPIPQSSGASGQIVFHVDDGNIADPANAAAIECHSGPSCAPPTTSRQSRIRSTPAVRPSAPTGTQRSRPSNYSLDPIEKRTLDEAVEAADIARDAGVQTELDGHARRRGDRRQRGHRPRRRRHRSAHRVRVADRDGDPDRHRPYRSRDRPWRTRDHGVLRGHAGHLDDDRVDDRPRRRNRLRTVRRHPTPPASPRRHVRRRCRRCCQRDGRTVGSVRRDDRCDRDHRARHGRAAGDHCHGIRSSDRRRLRDGRSP